MKSLMFQPKILTLLIMILMAFLVSSCAHMVKSKDLAEDVSNGDRERILYEIITNRDRGDIGPGHWN